MCLENCFPLICCSMDGSTCLLFYEKTKQNKTKRGDDLERNQQEKVGCSRVCFTLNYYFLAFSRVQPTKKLQNDNSVFEIKIKLKKHYMIVERQMCLTVEYDWKNWKKVRKDKYFKA